MPCPADASYLFSFNPEPGTAMEDVPRTPIGRLRCIQLAKHLIEKERLPRAAIVFDDEDNIQGMDVPGEILDGATASGLPFMTDGCPNRQGELACNRPYGSYRPGEEFRDYPFPPREEDITTIREQMQL